MILILGANGQVGKALAETLGNHATALNRNSADLSQPSSLLPLMDCLRPQLVFNAAAYTQVDLAEKEPELAFRVNAESPGILADWCARNGSIFVHYSTDYVFPGTGRMPWKEDDPVEPLNEYGRTKLEGEKRVQKAGGKYLIFRTSWVYDATGKNFVNTMLRLGQEREHLKVVSDQIGAPTYAPDLAKASLSAAQSDFQSGIYHLCNRGETHWHEFAETIFALAKEIGIPLKVNRLEAIPSSAYPTTARRPLNSRLNTEKARVELGIEMPDWKDGLRRCMEQIRK
jgi:dTDP-4-dehydrorhamnose reductase